MYVDHDSPVGSSEKCTSNIVEHWKRRREGKVVEHMRASQATCSLLAACMRRLFRSYPPSFSTFHEESSLIVLLFSVPPTSSWSQWDCRSSRADPERGRREVSVCNNSVSDLIRVIEHVCICARVFSTQTSEDEHTDDKVIARYARVDGFCWCHEKKGR